MTSLSVQNIAKYFGEQRLFEGVTFDIGDRDKIGLVGANGCGKTTLFRILTGETAPEAGGIVRAKTTRLGYLEQHACSDGDRSLLDEVLLVFAPVMDMEAELQRITDRLAGSESGDESLIERQHLLRERFEDAGGLTYLSRTKAALLGLGFDEAALSQPVSSLSGGQRSKAAMARLLLSDANLLLLDEPTNHLDISSVEWLEEFLRAYPGGVVVISHDRYFLDKVVREIWEIEFQSMRIFSGNYSKYKVLKAEMMARWEKEYEAQQEEIADLEDYIARNIVRATTSKSAKSRVKKLERMELIERPKEFNKRISLRFDFDRDPVKEVLSVSEAALTVGEGESRKKLFENLSFVAERGDKIAIIGENGIGKTSLLRAIQGQLKLDAGKYRWGQEVKLAYFEQENKQMNPNNTVLEELWSRYPRKTETEIRKILGQVLLTGENVYKKVGVLSGGERAKLAFALLMMQRGNVLILDEPTNHLDLWSKEILEEALQGFNGTLLFVSHDRYLLQAVPDRIIEIFDDHVEVFKGNYDYYLEKQQQKEQQRQAAPSEKKAAPSGNQSNYRSKQQRAEDARRRAKIRELEKEMEELERQIAEIEDHLLHPEIFENDYQKMQEECALLEELKQILSDRTDLWVELSE